MWKREEKIIEKFFAPTSKMLVIFVGAVKSCGYGLNMI